MGRSACVNATPYMQVRKVSHLEPTHVGYYDRDHHRGGAETTSVEADPPERVSKALLLVEVCECGV